MTDTAEWAAGLFEGEGCISTQRPKGHCYAQVMLEMSDEDVVRRFQSAVGCGTVYKNRAPNEGHKQMYRWYTGKQANVLRVMGLLLPYLGERRMARWAEVYTESEWKDN